MADNLPKTSPFLSRFKSAFAAAEGRLFAMPRRRIILLVLALALGFALLGIVLGIVLSPYNPTATPPLDSGTANGDDQLSSYTGVVRALSAPKEGASYYLELAEGKQILLKSTSIDIAFFKNASVTVEGIAVGSADGTEQILFINRIRIK
jgi:hypothetical protein